jgi:hypothetical protein
MMMNSKNPLLLIACSLKQTKRELSFPRIGAAGPPQSVVVTMRRDPEGLFGHNTPERRTVRFMRDIVAVLLLAVVGVASAMAEVPERARADIDRIIRDKGTYAADEGVYKVVLPREAATIVQDSQTLSPNVGLNSWAAFISGVHHEAVLTGQLLLLEDEVDTVLPAALDAGLQVTGLADSSLFAGPRLEVLDVAGVGTYQGLASSFRKALDAIQRRRISTPRPVEKLPELSLDSSINPEPLNAILSMRGSVSQGVYRAAIGQRALLFGELLGREMGISTWIVFTGTDNNSLAHGEFVTRPDELQKLLKALISRNIRVVSIRNHMVGEHPEFLFVRFWQQGRSVEVARGVRYALDVQVGAIATERSASQ